MPDDLALLEESRDELLQGLRRVSDSALDWQPVPGSRTIGEALLHIAGVELILACAAAASYDEQLLTVLWDRVKPGFATDAGVAAPPRGLGLDHYRGLLEETRAVTRAALEGDADRHIDARAVQALIARLVDDGALSAEHSRPVLELLDDHLGVASVAVTLVVHEAYHRGQLLLLNFLSSRSA